MPFAPDEAGDLAALRARWRAARRTIFAVWPELRGELLREVRDYASTNRLFSADGRLDAAGWVRAIEAFAAELDAALEPADGAEADCVEVEADEPAVVEAQA